jgi:hypothetical protein
MTVSVHQHHKIPLRGMEHSVEALDRNYDRAAADDVQPMSAFWKTNAEWRLRRTGKHGIPTHPDEFEHI